MPEDIPYRQARNIFYIFLFLHVTVWTIAPALLRHNLPLDSIEGVIWGSEWQWGYDKNPYLNALITRFAISLSENCSWILYLCSQLSVAACLWSVWAVGKKILNNNVAALMAVLVLETVQYFNFHAIDFNDNTLELGLWGLTIYCFFHACTNQSNKVKNYFAWLGTGFFAGFALMAKYYTALLIVALLLFIIFDRQTRRQIVSLSFFAGCGIFLLIIAPHFVWLSQHHFITLKYALLRTDVATNSLSDHLLFPARFAWQQGIVFLPAMILILLMRLPVLSQSGEVTALRDRHKKFLLLIFFGPFILTLLLSLVFGFKLRAGWGMPLLSFWGVASVAFLQPAMNRSKLQIFITSIFSLMGLLVIGYGISILKSTTITSANFPGDEIASLVTKKWHARFHSKLPYVAGSRWLGGNIHFYSPDHPRVYPEWRTDHAPWIDEADLRRRGSVFIWHLSEGESLPDAIKMRFARLELDEAEILEFSWKHDKTKQLSPTRIGIAILPPLNATSGPN